MGGRWVKNPVPWVLATQLLLLVFSTTGQPFAWFPTGKPCISSDLSWKKRRIVAHSAGV
jgi:hypothetical protein